MKRIWFFIIPLVIFFLSISTVSAATINKPTNYLGMVGYWTFDGKDISGTTAYDRSGQGNNGNTYGGTTYTAGNIGQAIQFDGLDDYLYLGGNSEYDLAQTYLTVSVWVKRDDTADTDYIFDKQGNNNRGWYLRINSSGSINVSSNGVSGSSFTTTDNFITDTEWHNIVLVKDNPIFYYLYVDGVSASLSQPSNPPQEGSGGLTMGGEITANSGDYPTSNFDDYTIDDVRIYNRALSAAEVSSLYNSGQAKVSRSTNDRLTDGLVGLWSFDGKDLSGTTAYDRSGQGNDGTLTFGPVPAIGVVGQALQFDGVDDYVDAGSDSSLDDLGPLTVSAWINLDYDDTHSFGIVSKRTDSFNDRHWWFGLTSADTNTIQFLRNTTAADLDVKSSANAISAGKWSNVLVTWDGSNTASTGVHIYVDGVETGYVLQQNGGGSQQSDAVENLVIGRRGSSDDFLGKIDDVRVYNRVLSYGEIQQLYNIGSVDKINRSTNDRLTDGLVGLWSFDGPDISGTTAFDRSGQGNNGTLTNGPVPVKGKIGQALSFDSTDDYVLLGTLPSIDHSAPATYAFWIYPTASSGESIYEKVYTRINTSPYGFSKTLGFLRQCAGGTLDKVTSLNNWVLNEWVHYVVTWDGTCNASGVKIYKNAQETSYYYETSPSGPVSANNYNAKIGNSGAPGYIDDFRFYDRILSSDEIKQLYNMGR